MEIPILVNLTAQNQRELSVMIYNGLSGMDLPQINVRFSTALKLVTSKARHIFSQIAKKTSK